MTDLKEIEETFALLDDWDDRYAYLIDLGRKLPAYPQDRRTEAYEVKGCVSKVWMILTTDHDRLRIQADSNGVITLGLIALIIAIYDDKPFSVLHTIDIEDIFDRLGFAEHLTINRRNGFFAMVETIKTYIATCK